MTSHLLDPPTSHMRQTRTQKKRNVLTCIPSGNESPGFELITVSFEKRDGFISSLLLVLFFSAYFASIALSAGRVRLRGAVMVVSRVRGMPVMSGMPSHGSLGNCARGTTGANAGVSGIP